jgi:zinc protease
MRSHPALMRTWLIAASTAFLATGVPARAQQANVSDPIPQVPVTKYSLPNGLTVLLSPDRSSPVAAVAVWYHVGSKNEKPGRTGFAHLFEHMMFTGTQHIPSGQHAKILESMGGEFNGTTDNDRTLYYEEVPSNQLATALWLESDRMGFLPEAMTQERLDVQRDVVKNERRLRVDNQPFGLSSELTSAALFPSTNPYSWPVIGSMTDLSAASLDDVKEFFHRYYAPDNAILSIVGDFTVPEARRLVAEYFGDLPRGPGIERPTVTPVQLSADKRLVLEDSRVSLPRLELAWPTVGDDAADHFALSALGSVLSLDRTSRLTKVLVYDRQLATNVGAGNRAFENTGQFQINVTPRPGASLTEIETVIDSVIAGVIAAPPTEQEVARARNYRVVSSVLQLQSALGKAFTLADGESTFGDPLADFKQLANYAAVTPAQVQAVARKYLGGGHVVLSMVPAGKLDLIAKPSLPYTNATPAAPVKP